MQDKPVAPRRVRALLFRAAYNLPVTAALERGVFARYGLDIELAWTRGSQMTVAGLDAGGFDLGVLSADDVVYEVETHASDLFVFMGLHSGILFLVARPGVRSAADLAGARLGVDDPASGFALVAHRLLRALGVPHYETVAVGGHEHRLPALAAGEIDVTLLTPPFTVQALAAGARVVARAADHLPRYLGSCGVTTRRWAAANREALVAWIRAYREGVAWALDPANGAAATQDLATTFGLPPAHAAATYAALVDPADGLYPDTRIDAEGLRTVLDLRVEAGLLPPGDRDLARYHDPSYLDYARVP